MRLSILANFIIFNIVWFACVLGAANNMAWIGLLALAGFAAFQLIISHDRVADIRLLPAAALIGWIIDTSYLQAGLLSYASPAPAGGLAPWWIVALWINFALIMNHSLYWLQPYPLLAGIFGFLGGPLAYYGGIQMDAVFPTIPTWQMLLTLGIVWAFVTPLLFWIARNTKTPVVMAVPIKLNERD